MEQPPGEQPLADSDREFEQVSEHARAQAVAASAANRDAAQVDAVHEVARLEEMLRERAHELQAQRERARSAEALARDLMAQIDAASAWAPPAADPGELQARALEAELGRAELQLRLDELHGHFATLQRADAERAAMRGDFERAHAELLGRERGLRAALAEAEESRDFERARATLLDHDLEAVRQARNEAVREAAELHEQLELEQLQARTLAGRLDGSMGAAQAAELVGELSGARFRIDEQEQCIAILSTLHAAARADGQVQRTTLGAVRAELSARQADHRDALSRAEHLERELARERERSREVAAELARREAEATSLREELGGALANATLLRNAVRVAEDSASASGQLLGSVRESAGAARERAAALLALVRSARAALTSVQDQLRGFADDSGGRPADATEPGTPLRFDEVEPEG